MKLLCVKSSYDETHSNLVGIFGYEDGSVGAAAVAVVLVHCVIAAYVYAAWKEGPTDFDTKRD